MTPHRLLHLTISPTKLNANQGARPVAPNQASLISLRPRLRIRLHLPRVYSRACRRVFIDGVCDPRVCGAACAFQHGGPLYIRASGISNALANTSTRFWHLGTFLLAHETPWSSVYLLVRPRARAQMYLPFHVRCTRLGSWGLSR